MRCVGRSDANAADSSSSRRGDRFPPGRSPSRLAALLVGPLAVVFGFLLPADDAIRRTASAQQPAAQQSAATQQPSAPLAVVEALEQAMVAAIARAEKSVVAIARVRKLPQQADLTEDDDARLFFPNRGPRRLDPENPDFAPNDYGAGVVVDRAGLIVTNYHVLGDLDASLYWVWTGGKPYPAVVKAVDPWLDLAVLQIAADRLEPIAWGDTRGLKKGQLVIALGNPQAIARDGQPSATWGIIANLARKAPPAGEASKSVAGRDTLHHFGTLIQTDARLTFGSSGGALVNLKGEMIGLTSSLAALEGRETSAGFAIPVDETFRRAVETLKAGRKPEYGFLGVALEPPPTGARQKDQVGVRVSQVVRGTPAERVGLAPGDLITHVGDSPIRDDVELIRELSKLPVEAEVPLTVVRGGLRQLAGKTQVFSVRLSKKPPGGPRPEFAVTPDPVWRGMRVDYATAMPGFGMRAGEVDVAGCVAVLDVAKDSAAWKSGLRSGSFLSHVGEQRVATPGEFLAAVAGQEGPVQVRLTSGKPGDQLRTVAAEK